MNNTRLDVEANETAQRVRDLKEAIEAETDNKVKNTLITDVEREHNKLKEQVAAAQASRNLKKIWAQKRTLDL